MRELESSFDANTSAMEKNRKKGELLEKSIKNQEKQVEELEKGLEAAKDKYGENATQTQKWKQAVSNAKTELNKMRTELNKVPKPLSEIGKSMKNAGKQMQTIGSTLTKSVTAPLTAVGVASVAAFKEVDDGMDKLAKMTGATRQELKNLEGTAKASRPRSRLHLRRLVLRSVRSTHVSA
jgi:chromosome segregation ATPase